VKAPPLSPPADRRLAWGVLATGHIARRFAEAVPGSRSARLVAVGSRTLASARRFAGDFPGVRAHGSYAALLADPAVEAVYLATPHPDHLAWALRAARAGKHVLCEKPLTLRRADTARMIAAARRHRVFLMEAFLYRCHPQTDALARLVHDGAIGRLRHVEVSFCLDRPFDPAHRLFDRRLGGGAILDLGCYPASFARRMAGAALGRFVAEPVGLDAAGRLHPVTLADETATATLRFPGGLTAALACGTIGRHEVSARLHGTAGWIDVPAPFAPGSPGLPDWIRLHRPGRRALCLAHPAPASHFALEMDVVGEAVRRGRREAAEMTWADSLGNAAVLDAWRGAVGVRYAGD